MSDHPMTEAEAAQAFADHLDELSRRTRLHGPGDPRRLQQILDEHEAMCVALEKAERDAAELERARRPS